MTEVAEGLPAQRTDEEPANEVAEPSYPYGESEETSAIDLAQAPAGDTADTVGEFAGDGADNAGESADNAGESAGGATDRVGQFAGDAADKVQEVAGEVAEKVGDVAAQVGAASGRIAAQVVDRLRNNAELAAERGSTTIANEVVEKIAGIAAREVPGVYDLGGDVARVLSAVRERVGLGEGESDQGVSVRLSGSTAAIKIVVVIEYGFVVYSVTEKVRAKVINAVENLLGLEVTAVDIVVDDVHVNEDSPAANG